MKTPEQMAEEYAEDKSKAYYIGQDGERKWYPSLRGKYTKEDFLTGYQVAKDQLADADKVMPQWISVKDRLPNVEKTSRSLRRESPCILLVSYGNVFVAHLCENWSDRSLFIFEACTCNCRAFDMDIDEWKLDQVTHWMPLPEPPKDEA